MSEVWSLVAEWSERLGQPVGEVDLATWLVDPVAGAGGMVHGRPRDERAQFVQLGVRSGRLEAAILQLTSPMPLAEMTTRLGPGGRWWAVDASHESISWILDGVNVTAQVSPDEHVSQLSLGLAGES